MNSISIIVPVHASDELRVAGLGECYRNLVSQCDARVDLEVLIADSSAPEYFAMVDRWCEGTAIRHFRPGTVSPPGRNRKLNSVEYALGHATKEYVVLLDDDCRPTPATAFGMAATVAQAKCVRFMTSYDCPGPIDMINLSGIYFINVVCPQRQFWGNIAFHRESLLALGFPNKDILFDEVGFDHKFRSTGERPKYVSAVAIPMIRNNTFTWFLRQRIRYAYENLILPARFISFLAIVPMVAVVAMVSMPLAMAAVGMLTIAVTLITMVGQRRYAPGAKWQTFLWAPVWFWCYPVCSWLGLIAHARGGVKFHGSRVRCVRPS